MLSNRSPAKKSNGDAVTDSSSSHSIQILNLLNPLILYKIFIKSPPSVPSAVVLVTFRFSLDNCQQSWTILPGRERNIILLENERAVRFGTVISKLL